jgi:uncharacterized membrane protein YraQ (UPF0718 family)
MRLLYLIATLFFLWSLIVDRKKTFKALQISWQKFIKILPAFLKMLIWVAIVLYFVPAKFITEYLGVSNNYLGVILGGLMGSISLMPGFIAYPLSGILLQQGVSYMTISSFVTTLMMVGVITYPVEKKYFG